MFWKKKKTKVEGPIEEEIKESEEIQVESQSIRPEFQEEEPAFVSQPIAENHFILPFDIAEQMFIAPAFLRRGGVSFSVNSPDERISQKRESIFTEELKEIVEDVRNRPNTQGQTRVPEIDWVENLPDRERRKLLETLDRLYLEETELKECLEDYFTSLLSQSKCSGFAIHLYVQPEGCFIPMASAGIDPETQINMVFLFEDKFLENEKGKNYVLLNLHGELREDIFFTKKFTDRDLNRFTSVLSYSLESADLPYRVFMFYTEIPDEITIEKNRELVFGALEPLKPFLDETALERNWPPNRDKRDLLASQIHLLKMATHGGHDPCYIQKYHLLVDNPLQIATDSVCELFEDIRSSFGEEDSLFRSSAVDFVVLSQKDLSQAIGLRIEKRGWKYEYQSQHFSDHGHKLFLYL